MNHVYRLVWSALLNAWLCVAEVARSKGKSRSGKANTTLIPLALLAAASLSQADAPPPAPTTLPGGGQVVAGQAQVQQSGPATLNIQQTSQRAAINWQSFNIGAAASVNFVQPSSQSVTLNRVLSSDPSQIFGKLTANGQVFLTNPNGIYFAPGASVDVGGLAATTHGISNADFMAGSNRFQRNGASGSVLNLGRLTAVPGGYIALLAPEVRNEGVIVARAGTVALAGGEDITLNFGNNNQLAGITVTPAQIRTLVENRHAIVTEGGQIIIAARSAEGLMGSVVNSGTLDATSLVSKGGSILLEGDDIRLSSNSHIEAKGQGGGGTVLIGGGPKGRGDMYQATTVHMAAGASIDASAMGQGEGGTVVLFSQLHNSAASTSVHGRIAARGGDQGGNGGLVETSSARVDFTGLRVDTRAALGATGLWLTDPYDLTVDASAASTINTNLASTHVTLQTTSSGSGGPGTANASGSGDIHINAPISWSTGNTLTLDAYRNININAAITASGAGKVVLVTGDIAGNGIGTSSGDYSFGLTANGFLGSLNFTNTPGGGQSLSINGDAYTLLYNLTGANSLAGMDGIDGKYALARSIDASSAGTLNAVVVETLTAPSIFTGLGHTVSNLTINTNSGNTAPIATNDGTVRDFGVTGGSITSSDEFINVGGLVAANTGVIRNAYSTTNVFSHGAGGTTNGGLVGRSDGTGNLTNVFATGSITLTGTGDAGGLIGFSSSGTSITNAFAAGMVTGGHDGSGIGGLIGECAVGCTITNVYATGAVTGGANEFSLGGLIGIHGGTITSAYATGAVFGGIAPRGGLAGSNNGTITNGYYDGGTTGQADTGRGLSQTTAQLQSGTLPNGFSSSLWSTGSGLYPHLTQFFPSGVHAISGTAYQASGTAAPVSSVNMYTGGSAISTLGVVNSGANGYYYAVMPTGTVPAAAATKLAGTQTLLGAGAVSGASYTDTPTVSNGNITGFDLKSGLFLASTGDTTLSSLNADLSSTFGASDHTNTATATASAFRQINASGAFTVDTAITQTGGLGLAALGGDLTLNAATSAGSGTLTLKSTGNVTEGASGSVTATRLLLLGGNVTLDGSSNSVTTLAAQNVSGLVYTNAAALTVGSIGPVNTGVTASAINGSSSTVAGITSTADVTLNILNSGNLAINNAVTATGRTITLQSTGTVTEGVNGTVVANNLLFLGGNITLNRNNNNVVTLAASGVGSLAYLDTNALTIGTVGNVSGISGTGIIDIAARFGNLTVARNVTTTNASTSAIALNGGQGFTPGTSTGGNLLISGSPTISTGAGGRATLYSGSTSDTSLATFIGLGSGRFRYNSDEFTPHYTTALGSGLYGIYRQTINTAAVASSPSVVYGDTLPSFTGSSGMVNGDAVTYSVSGLQNSSSGHTQVGSYTISATNLAALAGLGYTSSGNANGTLAVTPKALTVSGITAADKVYDGGVSATVGSSGAAFAGLINGDAVGVSATGSFGDKNAGIGKTVTLASSYTGADLGNYTITDQASANATVTPKALTVSGIIAADKVYDGTTAASVNSAGAVFAGLVNGDALTLSSSGVFADKNIGNGKTVTLGNSYAGADVDNYTITSQASTTANIGQALLTVTANTDARFVTQSDVANYNGAHYSGFVGGDTSAVLDTSNLTITRPNVSADVAVGTYTGALIPSGVGVSNYIIRYVPGTYTILGANNALVKVVNTSSTYGNAPGYNVQSVQYMDGSHVISALALATHNGNSFSYSDGVGGTITFTLAPANAALSSSGNTSVGNYAIQDANPVIGGGNLSGPVTFTGNQAVQAKAVTANASGASKVYDGTTGLANVILGLSGVVGADALGVSATSGNFLQKNVGRQLSYALNGLALGGADQGNYYISGGTSVTSSDGVITPKAVSVSGLSAGSKVYDGGTAATVYTAAAVFTGLVGGDDVGVHATGTFGDKNVGMGKAVSLVSNYVGADAGNYSFTDQQSTTADMTPKVLTVSGLHANDRSFDGTTGATVDTIGAQFTGLVAGDVLTVSATGRFTDKNVGVGKTVNLVSSYGGADVGNYTIGSQTRASANITPALLSVSSRDVSKVYDGNTSVFGGVTTLIGGTLFGADALSGGSFAYADKNAGAGNKVVSVSGISVQDGNGGANYAVSHLDNTSSTITPKSLIVSAKDDVKPTSSTPYSGGNGVSYTGFATGDDASSLGGLLSYGGSAQGALNPGLYTITPQGLSSGNYSVSYQDGRLTLLSTQLPLPPPPPNDGGGSGAGGATAGGVGGGAGGGTRGGAATSGGLDDNWSSGGGSSAMGGGAADSGLLGRNGTVGGTGGDDNEVTVELVRVPDQAEDGFATVWVPHDISTKGTGFSFTLPERLQQGLPADAPSEARMRNGDALPSWLRYISATRSFVASAVPNGGLPLDVVVTINKIRIIVVVTERPEK